MKDFTCRVCGNNSYGTFTISTSTDGTTPNYNLFCCNQCSSIFLDPVKFNLPIVKFKKLTPDAIPPQKAYNDDSCFDMFSNENVIVPAGEVVLVKTDIAIELPPSHEGQVRCRSGLGKKGIQVSNSPGTIDSAYRGNCGILIYNSTVRKFEIKKGERIAQLAIKTSIPYKLVEVKELSKTSRGDGGFGSTGK